MDIQDVKEYIAREKEKTSCIISHMKSQTFELNDIYPEYNLKEIKGPYSTSLEPYSKVWELIPFREKIIVHVTIRLPNEKEFARFYGVSVDDLLELERKGRVLLMVTLPKEYSNSIPSYLDPIIQRNPPSSIRFEAIYSKLNPQQFETCERIAKTFASLSKVAVDGTRDMKGDRAYYTTRALALQLASLGYNSELEKIQLLLGQGNINQARRALEFLRLFSVGHLYYSLGGLHTIPWKALGPSAQFPEGVVNRIEFFEDRIAQVLVRKLRLYRPKSLEESLHVFNDYSKARKALYEAQEWLRKKGIDNTQIEEIEKKFNEVLEAFDKRKLICEIIFLGADVILATLPGGFLPALIVTASKVSELVARILSKPDPIKTNIAALITEPSLRTFFNVKEQAFLSRSKGSM